MKLNEERTQGDLISRKYLKEKIPELWSHDDAIDIWIKRFDVEDLIDNAPGQWIPITFRQADDDEYKEFIERHGDIPREECKVCDCRMPDDGQEVLISTRGGHVYEDIFCADPDFYGFEDSDLDDVIAWMPKPEPYKKEGAE